MTFNPVKRKGKVSGVKGNEEKNKLGGYKNNCIQDGVNNRSGDKQGQRKFVKREKNKENGPSGRLTVWWESGCYLKSLQFILNLDVYKVPD